MLRSRPGSAEVGAHGRRSAWIITTAVGAGEPGFAGDGGPAAQALLNGPFDVGFDPAGNLYFSDTFNHRIRRVDALSGIIATVAGIGERGYAGDGGPATAAAFNEPYGIAVDRSGNIYLADRHNHCVRRIDGLLGLVTTFAGNGKRRVCRRWWTGSRSAGSFRTQRAGFRPGRTAALYRRRRRSIGCGLSTLLAARSRPLPAPVPRRIAATAARPRRLPCSAPARSKSRRTAPSISSSARAARLRAVDPRYRIDHDGRRHRCPRLPRRRRPRARCAVRRAEGICPRPRRRHPRRRYRKPRDPAHRGGNPIVETIAGGRQGADGDGGPATRGRARPAAWRRRRPRWGDLYRRHRKPPHPQAHPAALTHALRSPLGRERGAVPRRDPWGCRPARCGRPGGS